MTIEDLDDEDGLTSIRFPIGVRLSKFPSRKNQNIKHIMDKHNCPGFLRNLTSFINSFNQDNLLTSGRLRNATLPFDSLDVFHGFRFSLDSLGNDIDESDEEELDNVKAKPRSPGSPARFDTVVVMTSDNCESTGLEGTSNDFYFVYY